MGFIITFIDFLFTALSMAILVRVLLSWVDPQGGNRITQVLHEMTEPILGPIRSIMPNIGMFDFSPIIAILLLNVLRSALMSALG
jgi:YggT family protein